MSSCTIWACTETIDPAAGLRAGDATSEGGGHHEDPDEGLPPRDEDGCHAIYAQDIVPTFELTIDEDVLDQIDWEFAHGKEQSDKGKDPDPYHPLAEFRYGDIVITTAQIRLRGNPDWWDAHDKFQFQISFDEDDDDGNFLGLKKLAFDAASANRHMLRDRLALAIMRDMGLIAPCANNARLDINGEYYGIFTNLEKVDEVFLERTFDDPSGDLWKRQEWKLQTNKKTSDDSRLEALKASESIEELETYMDVEQALRVYAAEAILPNGDGGWAGGKNFYLYDDPLDGRFKLIPWDLDGTFERFDGREGYPENPDPVTWEKQNTHGRPWYDLALEDEQYFWYYIEAIETQFEAGYQEDVLAARIAAWADQIEESVLEDENKHYSNSDWYDEVEDLENYVEDRHDFLQEWLECWQDGGKPDEDGYCDG